MRLSMVLHKPACNICSYTQLRDFQGSARIHSCNRPAGLQVVAGKQAKLRKTKKESTTKELQHADPAKASSSGTVDQDLSAQDTLLPGNPLGALSDFAVPAEPRESESNGTSKWQEESRPEVSTARSDATSQDEQMSSSEGSGLGKLLIWVFTLMIGIGAFYGVVFAASGGISSFLKDRVTFTRKDFIPYSERRRMEAELKEKEDAERAANGEAIDSRPAPNLPSMPQDLMNLLPAPPKR